MQANDCDRDLLRMGQPPQDPQLLDWLTVAQDIWEDFAIREYLDRYIADGGSQVKIVIGKPGSGKTHLLRRLESAAQERGFIIASLQASSIQPQRTNRSQSASRLHINDLYAAVARHLNLDGLTDALARHIVEEMGYDYGDVPPKQSFAEWAESRGRFPAAIRREIRECSEAFFKQREMETSFCLAFIQLAADKLGVRRLRKDEIDTLYDWLRGGWFPVAQLRSVLIPRSIDRYNAREMFDSLSRLACDMGFKGLMITIDGVEDIVGRDPETRRWRYTKPALNDVYQSLREFVDSMPTLKSVLFVMAGRRELLDDEIRGIKSYDALWLRLQHEVAVPGRFNRFGQIIDLDRAAETSLDEGDLRSLVQRVREAAGGDPQYGEIPETAMPSSGAEGIFRQLVKAALTRDQ